MDISIYYDRVLRTNNKLLSHISLNLYTFNNKRYWQTQIFVKCSFYLLLFLFFYLPHTRNIVLYYCYGDVFKLFCSEL